MRCGRNKKKGCRRNSLRSNIDDRVVKADEGRVPPRDDDDDDDDDSIIHDPRMLLLLLVLAVVVSIPRPDGMWPSVPLFTAFPVHSCNCTLASFVVAHTRTGGTHGTQPTRTHSRHHQDSPLLEFVVEPERFQLVAHHVRL